MFRRPLVLVLALACAATAVVAMRAFAQSSDPIQAQAPEQVPPPIAAPPKPIVVGPPATSDLGTSFNTPPGALIAPGKAPDLTVLHTGDVVGYVDTCGCPKNPAGGLARRAWVLNQLKTNYPGTPQVLLDSGNFTDNPTAAGDIRTDALIEAMGRLNYAAVNVGERELMLGYDEFARRTATAKFPLVSTNIVRQDTKEPVFRPFVIVETARGDGKPIKVGVLGIVRFNPLFLKSGPQKSNLVIAPAREALKRYLPEVRRRADVVVLLAGIHQDDARLLAREVGDIDFVLGAYGGLISSQEENENGARLVYVGNQGKCISENRVYFDPNTGKRSAARTWVHLLAARYPDDPEMQQFVGTVITKINDLKQTERAKAGEAKIAAAERPFAGPATCKGCHEQAFEQWSGSPHAHAFQTLIGKGASTDARCVPCHVTGGIDAGGFKDLATTPELVNVTCESCHGPGTEHAVRPKKGYGKIELASCIACHNRANSPNFDFYAYLPRVVHSERSAH